MCQIQNENQTQKRKIETKNKTNTIIPTHGVCPAEGLINE